ncbi:MAG: hypothetical protein AVO35_05540 [Candidatus Aegiribacteria sp. MLS_C]|nr:MAG: hypothetical protein AVO35_05540 [Candidatus Aegiribacteria sp. MLS_C]
MKHSNGRGRSLVPGLLGMLAAAGIGTGTVRGESAEPPGGAPVTPGEGSVRGSFLTRTSVLWSSPRWQEFRRVWRVLDEFTPEDGDYSRSHLEPKEAEKLRIELQDAIMGLESVREELGLGETELRLFSRLARDRLELLSYGVRFPTTRMMPPPVHDQTFDLVPVIEARIDTIRELRQRGLLTGPEMQGAFEALRNAAELYCLLETVNMNTGYDGRLRDQTWPVDADRIQDHLDSLRVSMTSGPAVSRDTPPDDLERIEDEFRRLEESLDDTRARLPLIRDMLISLELI